MGFFSKTKVAKCCSTGSRHHQQESSYVQPARPATAQVQRYREPAPPKVDKGKGKARADYWSDTVTPSHDRTRNNRSEARRSSNRADNSDNADPYLQAFWTGEASRRVSKNARQERGHNTSSSAWEGGSAWGGLFASFRS